MKAAFCATLAVLLLTGCGGPELSEGNARTAMVELSDADKVKGALSEAERHCANYGRTAQLRGRLTQDQLAYDCVEP